MKKALEINPDSVMAYYNIGSAYQIQQNHEKHVNIWQKAVELDEDVRVLLQLWQCPKLS